MPDRIRRSGAPPAGSGHRPCRNDSVINIQRLDDLRIWSRKFGVSPDLLKQAVALVGSHPLTVQKHLQQAEVDGAREH